MTAVAAGPLGDLVNCSRRGERVVEGGVVAALSISVSCQP